MHLANRLIPCLIPLGLAALLAGGGHGVAALVFPELRVEIDATVRLDVQRSTMRPA